MSARGLLSRQGEVAIAKRIEAGREAMIAGMCESPLTFRAVIIWRDELNGGKVFVHDIISSAFSSIASAGASARKIRSAQQYARHAPITSPLSR
jgi:RNA polymerase primary sigma factor